jgi:predicted nuclease of predicted toxin-antitoxin system
MRVLLDECVPRPLRSELTEHEARTVADMGWSGIKNGQLLQKAASAFDCFLTVDRNLQFQQRLDSLPLAVLVIRASDNRLETLRSLIPEILQALGSIKPSELKVIGR